MQIYVRVVTWMYTNTVIYQGVSKNLVSSGTKPQNKKQTGKGHRKIILVSSTCRILVLSEHPSMSSIKQSNKTTSCSC